MIADTCLLITLFMTPLYGQGFDALLNELSGSDADQLESELADKKGDPSSSKTDAPFLSEEDEFAPEKNIVTNGVTLQGLDKQTARVFIINAPIGKPIEFGSLKIVVHHCENAPLEDYQESMAFITISDRRSKSATHPLFSGWMFASSPSLSALDHPIYDVWIKGCKNID